MIYPAISELMKKADSRYSLVVATAKRAREIVEGADALVDTDTNKSVSIAINEMYNNKIKLVYNQPAKKQAEVKEEEENAQQ